MCTNDEVSAVDRLRADLDELVATDVAGLSDAELRSQMVALQAAVNQLNAAWAARVGSFDARGLADDDACKTTAAWLRAYGRCSDGAAARTVKHARLLRDLPAVAEAAGRGDVTAEHVGRIQQLAKQVGVEAVRPADQILADAASKLTVPELGLVCDRIRDYVDPDGPEPIDLYEQRELTVSQRDGMVAIRGTLDPDGGAAVLEAVDALMRPPGPDDFRTVGQRRADALVDLARRALAQGDLPTVGGMRPQIGILITPETLLHHRKHDDCRDEAADDDGNARNDSHEAAADDTGADEPHDETTTDEAPTSSESARGDPLAPLGLPPPVQPAWLNWFGPVAPATAQRLFCDSDLWRIVLDPTTGLPLDVGNKHRLVPPWIRRALHARDRGCRWPGCTTPAAWSDAHHIYDWHTHHRTRIDELVLLCRYHHVLVHEGGWTIHLDRTTGHVTVTRPDGTPHDLGPSHPWTTPTKRNDHPPPEVT